jgi:ribosomal protein S10
VDDFYIYYELEQQSHTVGTIKAIAPRKLDDMGDMEFIRASSKIGLSFTTGSESLNRWVVKWLPEFAEMRLYKREFEKMESVTNFLQIIPTRQTKAQVTVTWKRESKLFNVRTRGVSISHPNIDMYFFVTRLNDPNIIYHQFSTSLLETMNRKGLDIPRDITLPNKFSVCTRTAFDRYQLRIE